MALLWPHKGMKMNAHLSVRAEGFAQPLSKHEPREWGAELLPATSAVHPSTMLRANGLATLFS